MAIHELRDDCFQQICEGCGSARQICYSDVTVGDKPSEKHQPNTIASPFCERCGAVEYLFCYDAIQDDQGARKNTHDQVCRLFSKIAEKS